MRATASILHLDMDAFFASVEQRDKPSLRGKPVIVGGTGTRGVVSTASYEVRPLGVRSAMAMSEARRRAPHAAVLSGRFDAYRQSSHIVLDLLRELSPLVEPVSLDEAYVDLEAGGIDCSNVDDVASLVTELRAELTRRTEGLHCSVGVGTSRLIAKLGSEAAKPNGQLITPPGAELDLVTPLPARAIPGIGPATMEKLTKLGIRTVADLQKASLTELTHELGTSSGEGLLALAFANGDATVIPSREVKSISVEDTFETDLDKVEDLVAVIDRDAALVAARLARNCLFARTITLKLKLADFSGHARSRTLNGATDHPDRIAAVARQLLTDVERHEPVRLLGVGVTNFTQAAQEELFYLDDDRALVDEVKVERPVEVVRRRYGDDWVPGMDVIHNEFGRGWVWGSGRGVVTIRFETRLTGIGPVRSLRADDPALRRPKCALPMTWERPDGDSN